MYTTKTNKLKKDTSPEYLVTSPEYLVTCTSELLTNEVLYIPVESLFVKPKSKIYMQGFFRLLSLTHIRMHKILM